MKKSERRLAENYLLQRIFEEDPDFVDHTMAAFSVSRSTVYNYINALQNAGELERVGGSMPYRVVYRTARFTIDTSKEDSEDRIFRRDVAPLLADLPQNVQKIWRYAFTAMLNNAFEHAGASAVNCVVNRNRLSTIVGVIDNGVGIFRRIAMTEREKTGDVLTPAEAATLLFAGGYTGAPGAHAGQGIFFTARLMDHFAIRSDAELFTLDSEAEKPTGDVFRGTAVQMALANDSDRDLSVVMARYVDPEAGFVRTDIPVSQFFRGFPVSRSEARELEKVLTGFDAAELDFAGVAEIGPDFADELFRVLPARRPDLIITPVHLAPTVEQAIRRARR